MSTKILVTGGNSQLAKCLRDLECNFSDFKLNYTNKAELDITNLEQVAKYFNKNKFDWCINCAAYTNVEKAELEKTKAFNVNQLGVKNIAQACSDNNTKLIHISTDFVFDGLASIAYTEKDKSNPLNVYGLSKLKGEKELQSILNQHFIIRTSWLYSEYGSNFLKTMLKLAETKDTINVVSDQIGAPTYAKDLVSAIFSIITKDSREYGIYNYSNEGKTSWYNFAQTIFEINKSSVNVIPVTSLNYPTLAERPKFSVLDKSKFKNTFNSTIPRWEYSLKTAIQNIYG
ncbi:MAG: dTDP-4-dehydrorhamnose reductase [Bacteroidetes bacterium]|nr:MAG: dTDP-4-dehydrorhamnose reductase [Bacteroidota bacterium]